jgi:hypothetical protein
MNFNCRIAGKKAREQEEPNKLTTAIIWRRWEDTQGHKTVFKKKTLSSCWQFSLFSNESTWVRVHEIGHLQYLNGALQSEVEEGRRVNRLAVSQFNLRKHRCS